MDELLHLRSIGFHVLPDEQRGACDLIVLVEVEGAPIIFEKAVVKAVRKKVVTIETPTNMVECRAQK